MGVSEKFLHWPLEGINAYQGSQFSGLAVPGGGFYEPISEQKCIFFSFRGRSAARRAPLSGSKFDFFWPEMWPIMWGVTTNFKLEDWWTQELARVVLVNSVGNR